MQDLGEFTDSLLARGRAHFSKEEGQAALGKTASGFVQAALRQSKKGRLVSPKRGFYVILRPEDRLLGAPEPARWIDPLMKHLGLDYRVSLLRAAAFHGSSHQAVMVFQVIAPKQISRIELGRQRIQFLYQAADHFKHVNRPEWLDRLKTDAGFAKVAGVELTLLDSARYFHKAAGINGAAQIVRDLGSKAQPAKLAEAARSYENAAVRRLGYLLDRFGCERQAKALRPFAAKAKSFKPLDPGAKAIVARRGSAMDRNAEWKLVINVPVEIDV